MEKDMDLVLELILMEIDMKVIGMLLKKVVVNLFLVMGMYMKECLKMIKEKV